MNNGAVRFKTILLASFALLFVLLITGILRSIRATKPSTETAQPQTKVLDEAKEAVDKGLEAARAQDWELAMAYFRQAQQLTPFDPTVLFNLALASDKSGKNQFNSIAWYRAYLILKPEAENAGLVRSRIRELEEIIEARIRTFIGKTEEAVRQIPSGYREGWNWTHFWMIVDAELSLGDVSAAVKSCELIPPDSMNNFDFTDLVEALTSKQGAEVAMALVENKVEQCKYSNLGVKNAGLIGIAKSQASRGKVSQVKETILKIDSELNQSDAFFECISILAKAGDVSAASDLVEAFNERYPLATAGAYQEIAKTQFISGELAAAKQTLKAAEEAAHKRFKRKQEFNNLIISTTADGNPIFLSEEAVKQFKIGDEYARYNVLARLAEAQAQIGEIEAARETMSFIDKNYQPEDLANRKVYKPLTLKGILSSIAIANIRFGKFSAAKKIIPQLTHESSNKAYLEMVKVMAQSAKFKQAEEMLNNIDDWNNKMEARRCIAEAKGEVARAKVYKIYALGGEYSFYRQEEFRRLLYSVDSKDISDAVVKLAGAAKDMSEVLKQLREIGP